VDNLFSADPYANRFLYTGREFLKEANLYDYRNRVYSAELGRFLQTDSIRFDAGDGNLYRYVANNPINYFDPLGLELVITGNPVVDAGLEGWSRASQGVVNAFTGGLFWPEEGWFYDDFNNQWEELESDSNDCDEAFDSGMGAGRSAIATGATVGLARGLAWLGASRLPGTAWINSNRYLRFGNSGHPARPTMRIGQARPPTPFNHIPLN
jgi:RHS repeat-associated protein